MTMAAAASKQGIILGRLWKALLLSRSKRLKENKKLMKRPKRAKKRGKEKRGKLPSDFFGKNGLSSGICLRIRFESVALPEVHSFLRPTMPTACCPGRSWSQTDIFHHQKWYEHPTTPMFRGFDQVWAPNPRVAPHHHQDQTVLRRRARVQALCSIQAANAVEIHTL